MRILYSALCLALLPSFAIASGPAAGNATDRFEGCLMTRAIALEPSGAEVSEIVATAERDCQNSKRGLAEAAAGEIVSKVRLAVMQQRSNALNTRRRG